MQPSTSSITGLVLLIVVLFGFILAFGFILGHRVDQKSKHEDEQRWLWSNFISEDGKRTDKTILKTLGYVALIWSGLSIISSFAGVCVLAVEIDKVIHTK